MRDRLPGVPVMPLERGVGIQLARRHASHLNCSDLHKSTLSISKSIYSFSGPSSIPYFFHAPTLARVLPFLH